VRPSPPAWLTAALLAACAPGSDAPERLTRCQDRVTALERRVRDLQGRLAAYEDELKRNGLMAPDGTIPEDPARLRCIQTAPGEIVLTDRGVAELMDGAGGLMDQGELGPAYDENLVFQGYRIERLDAGSIAAECGLRSGDVIAEINGHVLAGPGDFTKLAQKLDKEGRIVAERIRSDGHLKVKVRRGDRVLTIRYTGIDPILDTMAPPPPEAALPP